MEILNEFFYDTQEYKEDTSEPLYRKFFTGTKNLKNNFNDIEMKITNGFRRFKSKINNSGYDEIFLTEKQKIFAGISPQISFIFPIGNRITENRIGFRFYNSNPLESNENVPFFTLVQKYKRKFIILEKNSDIQDFNEKNFIDDQLDCFEVIYNIIKNKYINKKDEFEIVYPFSLVELLGFCYAVKEKKFETFEILEPYFPDDFDASTKTENFIPNVEKAYLEPLLCNQHVSLLLFGFNKNLCRKNIIIDFSSNHYESIKKYDPIFKIEMNSNLLKFPSKKIQLGQSCSLWFICSLLTIIENENPQIKFKEKNFIIKVIKKIEKIMGVKEKDTIIDFNEINGKENENISLEYFISNKIIYNCFIDVKNFFSIFDDIPNSISIEDLYYYQLKFFEFSNKIDDLRLNQIYYDMISDNIKINEEEIINLKKKYYNAQEKFKELFNDNKIIYNTKPKYTDKYLELVKIFNKKEKDLKNFIEDILSTKYGFIAFNRSQFFKKIIDTNDIFLRSFDK